MSRQHRRAFLKTAAVTGTCSAVSASVLSSALAASGNSSDAVDTVTHQTTFNLLKGGGRIPVIFDTDIGSDIDDTWALLYLLKCPELNIRLVAGDAGDARYRARLAAKYLTACGRTDIPVAIGLGNKDGLGHQQDWVGDYNLDSYEGTVFDNAVDAIIRTIKSSKEPVTVVCVGAVPNIAAALKKDPSICRNARFVGMHGAIEVGYGGRPPVVAEANVRSNPKALQTTFAADWECSVTPLDTCGIVDLKGEQYQRILSSKAVGIAELIANYEAWLTRVPWLKVKPDPQKRSSTLFDLVAVTMAFTEEHLKMKTIPLQVDDEGMTVRNEKFRPIRCAMEWNDLNAYREHIVDRLTSQ